MGFDWDKWRANKTGWLGRRGEVFIASDECPRKRCSLFPIPIRRKAKQFGLTGDNNGNEAVHQLTVRPSPEGGSQSNA